MRIAIQIAMKKHRKQKRTLAHDLFSLREGDVQYTDVTDVGEVD